MKTNTKLDPFHKKQNLITLFLCCLGVMVNILFNSIVMLFNLPMYIDTVGTIAVAAMGGYLPGVLVGFTTNIIRNIFNGASLYYGVLNVLIAIAGCFMYNRGFHKKIKGFIVMVLVLALIGGLLGSLIPMFIEGLSFESESLGSILYNTGYFSKPVALVLASFILDIPDKILVLFMVMIILRFIPEKYYTYFRFQGWQQNPIPRDEVLYTYRKKLRVHSLQIKILFALASSLLIVSIVAMVIGVKVYEKTVVEEHQKIAQGTAKNVASIIDGDRIDEYLEKRGDVSGYTKTKETITSIRNHTNEVSYVYVYKIEEDGCYTVFDADSPETKGDLVGTVVPLDDEMKKLLPKLLRGARIKPIIGNSKYGELMTAFEPIFDSKGRCVCYVCVDVEMSSVQRMKRSFLAEVASVFFAFFFVICTFVIWLAEYHIIFPINAIVSAINNLFKNADNQVFVDDDVKMFRSLGIRTGDEIELLYNTTCMLTKYQAEQFRSIRRLSDSTLKMQDGLIITMADLVESRDSDTGAHVQKTAAYVKIIVEGLKKKGYYAEKLTPKFMSDVVRSAPLHDIGKINISDKILNKPGKLTDEEYEIMKTHTTAGKRIMENAISTVEGDSYLKEARNMAAYHHERWDGKGYPEGIHGEVIPLSARIMAVADVFDALTSPRVYKPAFSLEKAISILEEGKGTQFDPKCVEVFLESLPEVKVILRKYNNDIV